MPSGFGTRVHQIYSGVPTFITRHVDALFAIRGDFVDVTSGRITRMIDQTANGHHWVESGTNGPNYSATAISGLPGGVANGSSLDLQNTTIGTALTAGEIFVVAQRSVDVPLVDSESGFLLFGSDAVNASYIPYTDGTIYDGWGSTVRKATVNPTPSLASPFLYSVTSKAGGWTSRLNGVQIYTTATNTVGWVSTKKLWSGGGSSHLIGKIAEAIMFKAELSASDRALVVAYLKSRYAIT